MPGAYYDDIRTSNFFLNIKKVGLFRPIIFTDATFYSENFINDMQCRKYYFLVITITYNSYSYIQI